MSDYVLLEDVEVKAATAKAVLLEVEGEEKWVPISCLDLEETDVKFEKGAKGTFAVKRWFAQQEGLAD